LSLKQRIRRATRRRGLGMPSLRRFVASSLRRFRQFRSISHARPFHRPAHRGRFNLLRRISTFAPPTPLNRLSPPALSAHRVPFITPLPGALLMHDAFPRHASESSESRNPDRPPRTPTPRRPSRPSSLRRSVASSLHHLSRLSEPPPLRQNAVCASSSR